jgi:hypothetical protein
MEFRASFFQPKYFVRFPLDVFEHLQIFLTRCFDGCLPFCCECTLTLFLGLHPASISGNLVTQALQFSSQLRGAWNVREMLPFSPAFTPNVKKSAGGALVNVEVLHYVDYVDGARIPLFDQICKHDLEGIVAKQKHAPYVTDREQSTCTKLGILAIRNGQDEKSYSNVSGAESQLLAGIRVPLRVWSWKRHEDEPAT